jgi:hypothetical protein
MPSGNEVSTGWIIFAMHVGSAFDMHFFYIKQQNMKRIAIITLILSSFGASAQDQTVKEIQSTAAAAVNDDTSHHQGWRKGALVNIGLAQGNTSNWAAGGEKFSLALNGHVNLFANLKDGKRSWFNNLDLFYGVLKTTSQGRRKNDDRIDFFSKYTYKMKGNLAFGGVANFRTQFTDGFDYESTPKRLISGLFAPAYLTLAPGFDWTPTAYFSLFFTPISARWTFVTNHTDLLGTKYGLDPGKSIRTEVGAYVSANFNKDILKNVNFRSRLDLYSNYLHNPQNIDVFWTNIISLKVNKLITVTYSFDLIYDDDIAQFGPTNSSPGTQIKSMLNVGITAKF